MDLASPQLVQKGMNSYDVVHGKDENLYVEFESVPLKQNFESEKEGRPIFKDVPHVRIMFPGDKTKQIFRPMNEHDKVRFSRQYAVYLETGKVELTGTPVDQWAVLTKSEAAEFKAMKIHTVEALAGLPDTALTWLGARNYRDKAKTWLDNAKDGAVSLKLQSENESLRADIEMLKGQIKELATLKTKQKDDK